MSLLEKLPKIVEQGRRTAEQILESLEGKNRITLQTREIVFPSRDSSIKDIFSEIKNEQNQFINRLIYGDNLLAMSALLAGDSYSESLRGKVQLIYIDPPFDSKADYRTKITLPSGDIEQKPTVIEQFAYSDTWKNGTASYLEMIVPRLILMRELLSDTGTLYLHVDARLSHYLKIVLDEIFGREMFITQIIWNRSKSKLKATSNKWLSVDDQILMYGKSENRKFNLLYWPYTEEYKKRFNLVDEHGKYYWAPIGTHSKERLELLLSQNRVKLPLKDGVMPRIKNYLHEGKGIPPDNLWTDIDAINSQAKEDTGYDTQKPMRLLERIIESATDKGDLVLDFFGGAGTTAAVCEKLERRWITTDLGKPACMVMRKRFIDLDAKPFLYQAIGDYQVETVRSTLGKRFGMGELARIVVELYGALPLPQDSNPNKDRGYIGKTLVICDSPNKITGLPTLKKAQALRDQLMGGWDKVVVLGWNFASDIGHSVSQLADSRLEVLVIPPDLMDRLRKKGSFDKLKDSIRFSSLQYLTVKDPKVTKGSQDTIEVELENYVLLSPEAINLDEANRKALQKVMNNDPLSLIEYWAVDTNYDGELFRSTWQDYRGNTDKDDDDLHVVRKAKLVVDSVSGTRKICVRAVDVFGFESEVILEV